jgi:hypothetical protein
MYCCRKLTSLPQRGGASGFLSIPRRRKDTNLLLAACCSNSHPFSGSISDRDHHSHAQTDECKYAKNENQREYYPADFLRIR